MSQGTHNGRVGLTRDLCDRNRANVKAEREGDRPDEERADRSSGEREGDGQHRAGYNNARYHARSAVLDDGTTGDAAADAYRHHRTAAGGDGETPRRNGGPPHEDGDGCRQGNDKVSLPNPTLQKLSSDNDTEHFLDMFECTAKQLEWPEEVWAMQLVGLLMGNAIAAYVNHSVESMNDYPTVRQAILRPIGSSSNSIGRSLVGPTVSGQTI